MTLAAPLHRDERDRIIELCGQGLGCNEIAEQVGRSSDTVSRVAHSIGHTFGRTNLARAQEARSGYAAERRAEIARMAAERAEELLRGFDDSQPVVTVGRDGAEVLDVSPDARAQRDRASAIQVLTKTILDIDRHDNRNDEGLAAVDQWLRDIVGEATA